MVAILVLLIGLPVFGASVVAGLRQRAVRIVSVITALITLGLSTWAVVATYPAPFERVFGQMPWLTRLKTVGLFGVMIDPLASLMLVVITGVGFLVVLYSTGYLSDRNREHDLSEGQARYHFWLLLFVGAMAGVAVSPNLLQLFIFWELTTLCSWALISHTREDKALRAGFKALIVTHVGGLFFLVSLFILFIATQSFGFDALARLSPGLRNLVFVFLLVAAWAKAAQIPFHTWLPDAMEAPTPISAYLHAAAMVKAGVYLIARVVSSSWSMPHSMGLVTAIFALVTMFMALSLYFAQDDLKRLLAYSTIAHLGYVLLGVGMGLLGSELAFRGGMLHIITHGFAKSTLFLSAGAVAYATGTRSISQLGGLGRKLPVVGLAFIVGALAVTGVPPLACFWSKFYLLTGAMQLGGGLGPVILGLVLLESLVSFAWFLRVAHKVFLGEPTATVLAIKDDAVLPYQMHIVLSVLIIMCAVAPFIGVPLVAHVPYMP
jgi:hydrogenase-4 component D